MGSGAWDQSRFKLSEARSPRRRRCSCPDRRERGFSASRQSLGQGLDLGVHSPSNATVSAADPTPSPSLIPGAHQVPGRAMARLCGSDKGVWTKGRRRLLIDADKWGISWRLAAFLSHKGRLIECHCFDPHSGLLCKPPLTRSTGQRKRRPLCWAPFSPGERGKTERIRKYLAAQRGQRRRLGCREPP